MHKADSWRWKIMNVLVLSCGGSVEPLCESIKKYKPDLVYFLHSEQSFYQAMYLLSLFDYDLRYDCKLVKEYQDLEAVFVKSRELIKELKEKGHDIRIDFTGGTKTMSAGLVLASIGQGCKHSYIGSKDLNGRDKNGLGIVLDGYELVTEQYDPYESQAIFEFERGKLFFDKYQFRAAKINFQDAKEKSKSENLKKLAEIYIKIVEFYDKWDKFDIVINDNFMLFYHLREYILKEIYKDAYLKKYFIREHSSFIEQIEKNIKFLEKKTYNSNKNPRYVNTDNINYYLPDLLNNAERRIEEGKYDDAVARLYRSMELIAQIKLTREGFINEQNLATNRNFKILKSKIDSLDDGLTIKKKVQDCYEYNRDSKKSFGIPSKKSYLLLKGLGIDFAKEYLDDNDIRNNVDLRNNSILAHGLDPIIDTKAAELLNQTIKYSKYICSNIEKCMDYSKFPKFNDE